MYSVNRRQSSSQDLSLRHRYYVSTCLLHASPSTNKKNATAVLLCFLAVQLTILLFTSSSQFSLIDFHTQLVVSFEFSLSRSYQSELEPRLQMTVNNNLAGQSQFTGHCFRRRVGPCFQFSRACIVFGRKQRLFDKFIFAIFCKTNRECQEFGWQPTTEFMFSRLLPIELLTRHLLFRTFNCRVGSCQSPGRRQYRSTGSQVTSLRRGSIYDIDEDLVLCLKDLTPERCVSSRHVT